MVLLPQRTVAGGRVVAALGVATERPSAIRCVSLANGVTMKSAGANSSIAAAAGVLKESPETNGSVTDTIGVAHECLIAKSAVAEATGGIVGKGLKTDSRTEADLLEADGVRS